MRKYEIYQIIDEDYFVLKNLLVMECYTQQDIANRRARQYLNMGITQSVLRNEDKLSSNDNVALGEIFNEIQEIEGCYNLSTGDIVKLDSKYYLCLACGWKEINLD